MLSDTDSLGVFADHSQSDSVTTERVPFLETARGRGVLTTTAGNADVDDCVVGESDD